MKTNHTATAKLPVTSTLVWRIEGEEIGDKTQAFIQQLDKERTDLKQQIGYWNHLFEIVTEGLKDIYRVSEASEVANIEAIKADLLLERIKNFRSQYLR